jgi:hypothetical protein
LDGRRDHADRHRARRDHHHSVVHVAQPACTSKPPSGRLLPFSGRLERTRR